MIKFRKDIKTLNDRWQLHQKASPEQGGYRYDQFVRVAKWGLFQWNSSGEYNAENAIKTTKRVPRQTSKQVEQNQVWRAIEWG